MRAEHEAAFEAFVAARSGDLLRVGFLLTADPGHRSGARVLWRCAWAALLPAPAPVAVRVRALDATGAVVAEAPVTGTAG